MSSTIHTFHLISISACHITISCTRYSLTCISSLFWPSGREHNAELPTKQAHFSWIFPLFPVFVTFHLSLNRQPTLRLFCPGQLPPSFHNGFTRKAPKAAAAVVAGCRVSYTLRAPPAKGGCSALQGISRFVWIDLND